MIAYNGRKYVYDGGYFFITENKDGSFDVWENNGVCGVHRAFISTMSLPEVVKNINFFVKK